MSPSPSSASRPAVDDSEASSGPSPSMRFPLPSGYFSDVDVTLDKRLVYRELVRSRVSTMLADEIRYAERRAQMQPIVPANEWKSLSPIGELNVYQRRHNGRTDQELAEDENFADGKIAVMHGNKSIVANGRVKGTIEDMLYGMSATTQGDLMTGLAFTAPPTDAALLGVVEPATVEDPLRSAELLWVLTNIPLIKQRDVCYLKATGVERDRNGSYGYMVLHSVDLPECPPFDRSAKVIRAKMFFSFLFRETTPGYIDVVARGIFDLSGKEILRVLLQSAAKSLLGGLLRGAECGKAKKLTLLARKNGDRRRAALSNQAVCSVCITGKKMFGKTSLRTCRVCGVVVCSSCKAKDAIAFLGREKPCNKITCCRNCEQQAILLTGVHLGDPEYTVVADYYRSKAGSSPSASSVSRSVVATTLYTPSLGSRSQRRLQEAASLDEASGQPRSLPSDIGKASSSVGMMTSSTVDESFASFASFASFDSLSELNSDIGRGDEFDELEVLPELVKEYTSANSPINEMDAASQGVKVWQERHRINVDDFVARQGGNNDQQTQSARRYPENMYEWMKSLQTSVNEAYYMTQASGEIMKKSLR